MAEFVEVFKQAQRLCNERERYCRECPASNAEDLCLLRPWVNNINPGEAEQRVMQWAKKHPEPQYPTWSEWLEEITGEMCDGDLLLSHVPDSIAKRLGIKPKEEKSE